MPALPKPCLQGGALQRALLRASHRKPASRVHFAPGPVRAAYSGGRTVSQRVSQQGVSLPWQQEQQQQQQPHPFQRCVTGYNRQLATNPLTTKGITCMIGSGLGDCIAQSMTGSSFDIWRNFTMAAYGLVVGGTVGHHWNGFLERSVLPSRPTSNLAVAAKVLLDQLCMAPISTAAFFSYLKLVNGHPEEIPLFLQDKLIPTLLASYMLWPAACWIGFRYIKADWRILYGNVIAVAWGAYVSFISYTPVNTDTLASVAEAVQEAVQEAVPSQEQLVNLAGSMVGQSPESLAQMADIVEKLVL